MKSSSNHHRLKVFGNRCLGALAIAIGLFLVAFVLESQDKLSGPQNEILFAVVGYLLLAGLCVVTFRSCKF